MAKESSKSITVPLLAAIITCLGAIIAAVIGVVGNIRVEQMRVEAVEAEKTRVALETMVTKASATNNSLQNTLNSTAPIASPAIPTTINVPSATATEEINPIIELPVIAVNYVGQTNIVDFNVTISTIQVMDFETMRWNLSFWNKTDNDVNIIMVPEGCAYVSNRDDGTRYAFKRSNYPNGGGIVKIQAQTRDEYWFEFEDGIQSGAKNFVMQLCPNPSVVAIGPYNVVISP